MRLILKIVLPTVGLLSTTLGFSRSSFAQHAPTAPTSPPSTARTDDEEPARRDPSSRDRGAPRNAPGRNAPALTGAPGSTAARARDDEDHTDGPAISVIGQGNALQRASGASTAISPAEIRQTQPLTTSEMLRRAPGVTVRDEEGMGLRPNISLRGLDPTRSRRVLLLEDGIPLALNPYGEPDAYYAPPLDRMERLEVVRGSGAIAYGPQTIGGVINYVTPAPPRREQWSVAGLAGDRALMGVNASYGNTVGNAGFLIQALHRRGDGFRSMRFEQTDLYAKLRLQLGARADLTMRLNVYDENSASTYLGLTAYQFRTDPTQNAARDDLFRVRRYSAAVIHVFRPTPQVRLQTTVFGYITTRDWSRQLYDRTPEPGRQYQRIVGVMPDGTAMGTPYEPGSAIYLRNANRSNDRYYDVYGVDARLTATTRSGPFRHELDVGLRALAERALLRVEFGDSPIARSGYLDSEEQHDGFALSGFVQDRVSLTERLSATLGLRVERYAFSRLIRRQNNADTYQRGANQLVVAIPGVSVAYTYPTASARSTVTVFSGAHVGYSPPRVTVAIDPRSTATQQLDAERSINLEVGTRFRVAGWLRGEAALFNVNFLNEIIAGSAAGGTAGFAFINGGASRYLGAEGSVEADFGALFRWQHSLYVQLRATAVDARQLSGETAGFVVPYAIPVTAGASVGFDHHGLPRGFSIGGQASWLYVGQQYTDRENTPEGAPDGLRGPIPWYQTFDLTARGSHRPTGLTVTLTVKNVLDQVYIASRLPEGIFPSGFRQFMVGLRWER